MLEELLLFVLSVGLVLAVLTVLGHGLWVLFAAIYRAITGSRPASDLWPRCPECQSRLVEPAQCRQCHWDATRVRSRAQFVSITRKEIDRLLRDQRISPSIHAEVVRALAAEKRSGSAAAQASPADPSRVVPTPASSADEFEDFVVAELVSDRAAAGAPPKSLAPSKPADPSQRPQKAPEVDRPPVVAPAGSVTKAGAPQEADSVRKRTAQYRQRRAEAAEPVRPPAPPSTPPPAEPRQPWLAAFMEEKHIRWGELVGGLMIVASSIALVVSFWSAIAERPMLKFGVLNGVTAALFGIGMYAAKRWKLPTTSQGILLTATLLVPLNFLAIAAFSEGSEQLTLPVLVGEGFSTILLASLVLMAARVITPSWPISVAAGIVLPAMGQLVLRRHIDSASSMPQVYGFALAGLTFYLGSQIPVLWRFRNEEHKPLGERQGNEVFKQLGLVTFSLAVAIGLLLVKAEQPVERLQWLAPLSILLAAPAMACGLLLWKRPGSTEHSLVVAGTTLAVASVGLAVAGLLLAWPQPGLLVACCALAGLTLLLMAWWYEIDEAHAAVAALASLGGTLILLLLRNTLPWSVGSAKELLTGLLSASGGRALTGVALVHLVAAWQWAERAKRIPAACYALVGAATAGLGLVLVTWFGWGLVGDPESLTWLLGFYGMVASVAAFRHRMAWGQLAGGLLFLAALGQGVVFGPWAGDLPRSTLWLIALLLHASLMSVFAAVARGGKRDELIGPSVAWSLVSSLAAAVLLVARPALWSMAVPAGHLAWIALIWLILAWVVRSTFLFSSFQAALALSLIVAVDHRLGSEAWYTSESRSWLHPTSLQWQGLLLAGFGLAWSLLRVAQLDRFLPNGTTADHAGRKWAATVLRPDAVSIDRGAVVVATVLLVLLAVGAVIPGIGQELSPVEQVGRLVPPVESFQLFGMPHQAAQGWLTWVLCGVVVIAFLFHLRERAEGNGLAGIMIAASSIPLLVAAQWEPEVAVASALRWSSALFFLLGSVGVWWRRPLSQWMQRAGIVPKHPSRLATTGFALLLFLAVAPILSMAIFVSFTSLSLKPATNDQLTLLWWLTMLAATVVLLVLGGRRWLPASRGDGTAVAGGLVILAIMPLFAMTAFVIGQALSDTRW